MPFINKLAACWQRQNNLLSNPIILPVPGWHMIPARHDLEESKKIWLSWLPKISSALFFLFFFFPLFNCQPCHLKDLSRRRDTRHNPWNLFGWCRQGTLSHSLPAPSQSPSDQAAIHTGLFPGGCYAGMPTGSFSLDTGAVDAGDVKETPQLGTAVCCVLPAALLLLPWKHDLLHFIDCHPAGKACECPTGNPAAEEQERRNKSVINSNGSKGLRSGGVWSGY